MKFLADECIERQIVNRLRHDGHVVSYVTELEPGISDHEVLNRANQEDAILLTADVDFGEPVFRQEKVAYGVILIRLAGQSPMDKVEIIANAIEDYQIEFSRSFTVIMPDNVRIRRKFSAVYESTDGHDAILQ